MVEMFVSRGGLVFYVGSTGTNCCLMRGRNLKSYNEEDRCINPLPGSRLSLHVTAP